MASSTTLPLTAGRLDRTTSLIRDNTALLPALGAIVIFVAMAGSEGGFYPIGTRQHAGLGWYPAAVLLLGLLASAAIATRPVRAPPRSVALALALLGGYTVWSYLSIAWAEQAAVAWDGANRTAMYFLVLALFGLWPFTARAGAILVGALGLGMAGLGLVELLRADAAAEPVLYFIDARFAEPAGYINANVALWTVGLWPCLYLASAPRANPLLRGLALGGAGVLACLALMGQSRGWIIAVPLAALLFVIFMPGRARALLAVGAVALGTLVASGSLVAVHDDFTPERMDSLLALATQRVLIVATVLAVVGTLAATVDRRVRLTPKQSRTVNRATVGGALVVLVLGTVVALFLVGNPIERLSASWESFKTGGDATAAGSSRFTSVGTNRYDFWVVALDRFQERPVAGIGSENFQQDYLARGNSGEQPRYPHSLVLGVLSQTGVVGSLLLAGALLAAGLAALGSRRRSSPEAAAVIGAAASVFAYWLIHASVDWFWEFPGLTAPAFAMLGLAAAVGRAQATESPRPSGAGRRLAFSSAPPVVSAGIAGVAAVALATSFVLPWLAEREVEQAATEWPAAPALAFDRLARAQSLNPLSPKPHLVAATIAVRVEDEARATDELKQVLRKEPRTPFALAELAALASERGQSELSTRLLDRASRYAPRDQVVSSALEEVRSGGRLDVRELNDSYLEVARSRIGR